MSTLTYLGESSGALAASTAAFARPWSASIGALSVDLGKPSSDWLSSSDGALLETMPYVAYLCGWGGVNELSVKRWDLPVPVLRTRVKMGTAVAVRVDVVQTLRLEMVGRRVHAEERGSKGVMVENLRIQRPKYGPRLFACQSCGSALPTTINMSRAEICCGENEDIRGIDPRDGTVVCRL